MLQVVSTIAYYPPNFTTGASYLTTGTLCTADGTYSKPLPPLVCPHWEETVLLFFEEFTKTLFLLVFKFYVCM